MIPGHEPGCTCGPCRSWDASRDGHIAVGEGIPKGAVSVLPDTAKEGQGLWLYFCVKCEQRTATQGKRPGHKGLWQHCSAEACAYIRQVEDPTDV